MGRILREAVIIDRHSRECGNPGKSVQSVDCRVSFT
jgi:hypothetical protein